MSKRQIGYLALLASIFIFVCVAAMGTNLVASATKSNSAQSGYWVWQRDANIDPSLITTAQFDKQSNSYKQATINLSKLGAAFPKNHPPPFVEAVWMPCANKENYNYGCIRLVPAGRWQWNRK